MGTCGLKGQIYERLSGKMLTSTKITLIPWNALGTLELRPQNLLSSFPCQYSRKRLALLRTNPPAVGPHSEKTVLVTQQVQQAWAGQTDLPGCPGPELYSWTGHLQPHRAALTCLGTVSGLLPQLPFFFFKKELSHKVLFPKLEKPCF